MTDTELKQSLEDRNIRLRQNRIDGSPIQWYYRYGGDFLVIPKDNHDSKLLDLVNNHPALTDQEKTLLINNFVYAVAEILNESDEYVPYTDVTAHEFDILYVGRSSGIWVDKEDETKEYKIVEIPRMFDHTGERDLMRLWGKGYTWPKYGISPAMEAIKTYLRQL